eukprot:g52881.t1
MWRAGQNCTQKEPTRFDWKDYYGPQEWSLLNHLEQLFDTPSNDEEKKEEETFKQPIQFLGSPAIVGDLDTVFTDTSATFPVVSGGVTSIFGDLIEGPTASAGTLQQPVATSNDGSDPSVDVQEKNDLPEVDVQEVACIGYVDINIRWEKAKQSADLIELTDSPVLRMASRRYTSQNRAPLGNRSNILRNTTEGTAGKGFLQKKSPAHFPTPKIYTQWPSRRTTVSSRSSNRQLSVMLASYAVAGMEMFLVPRQYTQSQPLTLSNKIVGRKKFI